MSPRTATPTVPGWPSATSARQRTELWARLFDHHAPGQRRGYDTQEVLARATLDHLVARARRRPIDHHHHAVAVRVQAVHLDLHEADHRHSREVGRHGLLRL